VGYHNYPSYTAGGLSFGDLAKQAGGGTVFSATPVAKEAPKVAPIFGAKKDGDDDVCAKA
jgi:hypothetical protein